MAKSIFAVGYALDTEKPGGVWIQEVTERKLKGDLNRTSARQSISESVNGTISLVNTVSVVADGYAMQHFSAIRYIKVDGVAWTVTSVSVERPRLILRMGEVYNGETAPTSQQV